jgi:tetratricopeptide (TPR) repeat protein
LQVLADSLSALGEEQHRRGHDPSDAYAQALDAYERGIALRPGDGGLWNGRCITYRLLGEWLSEHGADAADAFERSVASAEETIRHSRDLRGHHSRALAYLGRAVWAVRRGQPPTTKWVEHTLEFHDELVTRTPNSAEAGWLRARRFEALRRWRDGLAALAQALLDSPDQPAAGELAERINRTRADAPRAWFK